MWPSWYGRREYGDRDKWRGFKELSAQPRGFSAGYATFDERRSPAAERTELCGQVERPISTGQLNPLLGLHLRPINPVISRGPSGRAHLGGGFTLRCFQRLSLPDVATQRCPEQDNWKTRGQSVPVLSY